MKIFLDSLKFLKYLLLKHKGFLEIVILVLILGFFVGFTAPNDFKETFFGGVFQKIGDFDNVKLILFYQIFWNNFLVDLIIFVSSLVIIGPVFIIFYNGLILGVFLDFYFRLSSVFDFIGTPFLLFSFLPHAIIEIPTTILSSFLSLLIISKIIFVKKVDPQRTRIEFIKRVFKIL